MLKLSLKTILGKKNDTASIIASLIEQLNVNIWVEDNSANILFGNRSESYKVEEIIKSDDEVIGVVRGDEAANIVAAILKQSIQKETEKKKLGSEVLNLYQEINLIYNFSERLAQTIDAPTISAITLEEAGRVIKSNGGVVLLWDEPTQRLKILASSGELFFVEEKLYSEIRLLSKILLSGQSEIITDVSVLSQAGILLPEVRSVIYSALKVNKRTMGAIILSSNELVQYTAADLKLLTTLALQSSAAIESALLYEKNLREAKEREEAMRLVYEATGKFVPYEFIGSLGHNVITDVKLGDQVEKIVTVLFSDIRDYTSLSEQMSPEENFKFVCAFNERMGPAIRRHNGFINQYLGDAIMAIFPRNAEDALLAAIEMQKEVQHLNKIRNANDQMPIQIGVGMHTGPLIMGITGDKDRMDATTISDTVNIASRLESLTKHYSVNIILSDSSLKQIGQKDGFHLRSLGLVQLKGKREAVEIHECFDSNPVPDKEKKLNTLAAFNEGVSFFLNKSFQEANLAFKKVVDTDPGDH
ncbi:MAG TPA: adenylate/guanylate cyclase domain-containing protein, partial [Chitinophagaceae bacterium]|nr:adenylate/guanylate cyclase domain-containing protein [Chitinophagaceae bacterium]